MSSPYKMTISRLTVDKLGVKLYDRVSAVLAELIANCYDADATKVLVTAPMDELLATKAQGQLLDKNLTISIVDNGHGMTPSEVNTCFLPIGKERRADKARGNKSRTFGRKVMGRKGVGKLAPFGICQQIEVLSSGGVLVDGKDAKGKTARGYLTAHFLLDRAAILEETDKPYFPNALQFDGVVMGEPGTTITLKVFDHRRVPTLTDLERQLAQRFGLKTNNWSIELIDSLKTNGDQDSKRNVGEFVVDQLSGTVLQLAPSVTEPTLGSSSSESDVLAPTGEGVTGIKPGFDFEGRFYPVKGWIGYSKSPYRDDLMAGVRIYCRGKLAGQSHIFNLKAGFTGEYDIRSYLIGVLYTDWLDEEDDLIRTDRQDILWSHPLGVAFEEWGRKLVKAMGALTREPTRKRTWELFRELSDIEQKLTNEFPSAEQESLRDNTLEIAKSIARTAREDEIQDADCRNALVDLSFLLGPHITLDKKLREAADKKDSPLSVITDILRTARIAELSGFGKIAEDRVKVIKRVELLKDDAKTLESALQKLIQEAPWLIDPEWSPLTRNQTFKTLATEFAKLYEKKTGNAILAGDFLQPSKQCDFVLSSQDGVIHIVEIKRPEHKLKDEEVTRVTTYIDLMGSFLHDPANALFASAFPTFHVTLVCDHLALSAVYSAALRSFENSGLLERINWKAFLAKTQNVHQQFLEEADKQRKHVTQSSK